MANHFRVSNSIFIPSSFISEQGPTASLWAGLRHPPSHRSSYFIAQYPRPALAGCSAGGQRPRAEAFVRAGWLQSGAPGLDRLGNVMTALRHP